MIAAASLRQLHAAIPPGLVGTGHRGHGITQTAALLSRLTSADDPLSTVRASSGAPSPAVARLGETADLRCTDQSPTS